MITVEVHRAVGANMFVVVCTVHLRIMELLENK